jgi:hypothetical protein
MLMLDLTGEKDRLMLIWFNDFWVVCWDWVSVKILTV